MFIFLIGSGPFLFAQANGKLKMNTVLNIYLENALVDDSFKIEIFDHYFRNSLPNRVGYAQNNKNGTYTFESNDLKQPVYINLFKQSSIDVPLLSILNIYLVEPGDNVTINIKKRNAKSTKYSIGFDPTYEVVFTGKGSTKYKCRYEFNEILGTNSGNRNILDSNLNFVSNNYFVKVYDLAYKNLKGYKNRISNKAYTILNVDFFSFIEIQKLESLSSNHLSYLKDTFLINKISSRYQYATKKSENDFPLEAKIASAYYSQYVLDKSSIGKYHGGSGKRIKEKYINEIYVFLKGYNEGELRDKLLTIFTFSITNSQFSESILGDVLTIVKGYYLEELNSFAEQNSVGKLAYNFNLPDTNSKLVRLEDFKGKVVFIDFWYNGCPGCVDYYINVVSKAEDHFKNNTEVVFLTISIDVDRKKWMTGIYSGKYTTPHIVNLFTDGKGSNHPIIKNFRVNSYPRPILIDREGKIYSNNDDELRRGGVTKLIDIIEKAVTSKQIGLSN